MKITFDYDNDEIRLYPSNLRSDMTTFKQVKNINIHAKIISELINMLCDGNEHPPIVLEKQDEGELTIIEEY